MRSPLVISNHALRHSGGIERYLLTLVRGLHARGIRPQVVVKKIDHRLEEAAWVDGLTIPVGWLPGKLRDEWFDYRLRRLKASRRWFPLVALNQTGAADIAICGSNHPAYLAAMGRTADWFDRRKVALERAHLENSLVVIAHSRLLANQAVTHYGIDASKIQVVYPPVDASRFRPVDVARRRELRASLGLADGQCAFLLASTGHARKGLDLAIEALRGRQSVLLVAGRPPGVEAPHLRYIGYRAAMEDVYPAADFTLMPSRYEPFGLVGIESVLCGTPLVVEQRVGCAETLDDRAAVRFDAERPETLAAALDAALLRVQAGLARLEVPTSHISYTPDVQAHLQALLTWVERLRDCHPSGSPESS